MEKFLLLGFIFTLLFYLLDIEKEVIQNYESKAGHSSTNKHGEN